MLEEEALIRRLLGNRYHLHVSYNSNSEYTWVLYKEYRDFEVYMSQDNKAIMSSNDSSDEDLLQFAKSHRKFNSCSIFSSLIFLISIIIFILNLVNLFTHSAFLLGVVISITLVNTLYLLVILTISENNRKVDMLELYESYCKRRK